MQPMGTVKVEEATIEVFVDGQETADTVVLLPGLGLDVSYFDDFARRLAEAGFRAVAVNPRGAGGSTGPMEVITLQTTLTDYGEILVPSEVPVTLHTLAADVARVIEALDCGSVHVLGHAFGNRVARCLAADHPHLVSSVILLAAGGRIPPEDKVKRAIEAWSREDATESECIEVMKSMVADPTTAESIWHRVKRWPAVAAAQIKAGQLTPTDYWWGGGNAPLLIVQGLEDRSAPPENARKLRDEFGTRVRLVEIPQAGHMLHLEQPEAVANAVLSLLRGGRKRWVLS